MPIDYWLWAQRGLTVLGGLEAVSRLASSTAKALPVMAGTDEQDNDEKDSSVILDIAGRLAGTGTVVIAGLEDVLMDIVPGMTAAKQKQASAKLKAELDKQTKASRKYSDDRDAAQDKRFNAADARHDAADKRHDAADKRHDTDIGTLKRQVTQDRIARTGADSRHDAKDKEHDAMLAAIRDKLAEYEKVYSAKVAEFSDRLVKLAERFDAFGKEKENEQVRALADSLKNMATTQQVSLPNLDAVANIELLMQAMNAGREQDYLAAATGQWDFQGWQDPSPFISAGNDKSHGDGDCHCGGACNECSEANIRENELFLAQNGMLGGMSLDLEGCQTGACPLRG